MSHHMLAALIDIQWQIDRYCRATDAGTKVDRDAILHLIARELWKCECNSQEFRQSLEELRSQPQWKESNG